MPITHAASGEIPSHSPTDTSRLSAPWTNSQHPVGAGEYVVHQGDSIESVAYEHGFTKETLWDHPDNSELRQARGHTNILLPGDRIHIPPIRLRTEQRTVDQHHWFRRSGTVAKVALRFITNPGGSAERAMANVPYTLEIDGQVTAGNTSRDGKVEVGIAPNASGGRITLEPGTEREISFLVNIGHLDPVTETSGVACRLRNLGFLDDQGDSSDVCSALRTFQSNYGLNITGEADPDTLNELRDAHAV